MAPEERILPLEKFRVGQLEVEIYASRQASGTAAAFQAGNFLKQTLEKQAEAAGIFAAAPSQNELLENLVKFPGIAWEKIRAFHLDEYLGLAETAPQAFRQFLHQHLWRLVNFGKVEKINGETSSPEAEASRYAALLKAVSLDLACIGIGENGHIAFNEPHLADFQDPFLVKLVDLDLTSRQQQVNDGCFSSLEEVPTRAVTVTIPPIMSARRLICVVPGLKKAEAVRAALYGPIQPDCPASILRRHPNATLFLDKDSASRLG